MLLQCFAVFLDEVPFLAYIFAGMFGFEEAEYFEADESVNTVPEVKF